MAPLNSSSNWQLATCSVAVQPVASRDSYAHVSLYVWHFALATQSAYEYELRVCGMQHVAASQAGSLIFSEMPSDLTGPISIDIRAIVKRNS